MAEMLDQLRFLAVSEPLLVSIRSSRQFFIAEQWRNKMREYTPWFKEQENSKANEALRPGGARATDDLFGMDGTFRQLTID